jgi:hemin uptake protein HemP
MNGHPSKSSPASPSTNQTPVFDVQELLGGGKEVIILHAGERYRLRITANDKLILTK